MARIAGVNIPKDKVVSIALTYIYGVGMAVSLQMCKVLSIPINIRVHALTDVQVSSLRDYLAEHHVVEGELRHDISEKIVRLKRIGCYRGIRHQMGLPVRGQNTQSNASRGKKKGNPVAGKKKVRK